MVEKRIVNQNNYSEEDGIVVTESIDKIKLWRDNPRKNDQGVKKLAELLKIYGQITPIVVWNKNMTVYKGNTTLKALLFNGEKTVKVLYKSFSSEQAAISYGIADNKSSEWGDWDNELLKIIFEKNKEFIDIKRTGFTEKEQKSFMLSSTIDKLPDMGLQEETKKLGKFVIITFDSKDQMNQFKKRFNMPMEQRKIEYTKLIGII